MERDVLVGFFQLVNEKERKEGRKITNKEIAEATGYSAATIGKWRKGEVGKFDLQILAAFCDYFGCEVGELLYLEPVEA